MLIKEVNDLTKKQYEIPTLEVEIFMVEDVMTDSVTEDPDWGMGEV